MADPVLTLQMQQTMNYVTGMVLNPLKQTLWQLITYLFQPRQLHLFCTIKEARISDNCSIPQFLIILSLQVNLVWNRQWSFMTALYLIARYFGSLYVIGNAACILVIRVYALFNRSKKVLIFLATSCVLQATATFVLTGLDTNKQVFDGYYASVGPASIGSAVQLVNVNPSMLPLLNTLNQDSTILSITFDTILLFFALWAFVIHALEAKTLNNGWSINVLVRTLMADHLLYFICNLVWLSLPISTYNSTELNFLIVLLHAVYYAVSALVVVAGPRMVISLRTTEKKTRGEGATLEAEVSTIWFGIGEPPTQSESAMEEGGLRAADANAQID
ncbi:hypothetical protein BJ138DRAFT_1210340 [Hygrophoropsis aurantiaca]|uniref:Uncharacterized protein n=1 Tax=Hygrophoropsis aurantiaca TaxID=72124 RepID=A0ACB8A339_9AGAM|nr:hypothetical protein BJ138DRAFT_1210340 [Hygrophoropsis aurantiaca]